VQVSKAQKDTDDLTVFLLFWDVLKLKVQVQLKGQFHQHLRELFSQYPFDKKLQSQNVTRENLRKALSYKK